MVDNITTTDVTIVWCNKSLRHKSQRSFPLLLAFFKNGNMVWDFYIMYETKITVYSKTSEGKTFMVFHSVGNLFLWIVALSISHISLPRTAISHSKCKVFHWKVLPHSYSMEFGQSRVQIMEIWIIKVLLYISCH